jgi:anti-sigma B factor antagonist
MVFRAETHGSPRCISLHGELDAATADDLQVVLDAATQGAGDVVLELTGLTFMDSSGLHALLRAAEQLEGRGRLVLHHPTGPVRRVLDISGIARICAVVVVPDLTAP